MRTYNILTIYHFAIVFCCYVVLLEISMWV